MPGAAELTSAVRLEAEVARADTGPGEALLELRADERLLTALPVPITGSRYTWTTVTQELPAPLDGMDNLHLTLHGDFRPAAFRLASPHAVAD